MCKIVFDIKKIIIFLFFFLFFFVFFLFLSSYYLFILSYFFYLFFCQLNQLSQYHFDKIFLPDSSTFHKTCI